MKAPAVSRWDYEVRLLAWMATCVSVFSFLFYFRNNYILLYGDAVAHINIARRVFDSKTPGFLQLGTVWLPLPHLLMMPFLVSGKLWRNGAGGSVPAMTAYVFGVIGIFRLTRGISEANPLGEKGPVRGAGLVPWIAALIYGANPNLIYMQTTAMGEAVYLALFVWAVTYFGEWVRGEGAAGVKCGVCVAAACMTRYDGWFLASALVAVAAVIHVRQTNRKQIESTSLTRASVVKFVLVAAAVPALWLIYNDVVYRNPLEFANGPYSAKAIERKTATVNPAKGNLYASASYFVKSAELNVAEPKWLGRLWVALGAVGLVMTLLDSPGYWVMVLVWTPLPFYALSIAYGGVPIFVPTWWPFSHYNVRYGLEMLPAFAVSLAGLSHIAGSYIRIAMWRRAVLFAILVVVMSGYFSVWMAGPICFHEASINSRGRIALENQLAAWLEFLPPDSTILIDLGEHPGALEQSGVVLRRTINEGNHRVWKRPSDPDGLWERALAQPAKFADYAVGFEGDEVFSALRGREFKELVEIGATGQARAVLYQLR